MLVAAEVVDSTNDSVDIHVLRLGWLNIRLVVNGHVVNHVRVWVVTVIHPLDTRANDVADFVTVGRVVADHRGVGLSNHRRVTVCVLQAFTCQSGSTSSSTDHETSRHLVGSRPNRVGGALESEHRIEHIDRNQWLTLCCIRGSNCGERRDRSCFVDTGVQNLTSGRLFIGEQEVTVYRKVVLTVRVVDFRGREECVHSKGARFIRDDRHKSLAEIWCAQQIF